MKHLIVYCHPNPDSFNNAVKEIFIKAREEKQDEIKVRDLYAMGFDPVLSKNDLEGFYNGDIPADIKEEQEHVTWADIITFICPIWWMDFPAMVHGYIDRVFSHGFAYAIKENGPEGLLEGKKVFIFNTTGGSEADYKDRGFNDSLRKTIDMGKFLFCNMEVVGHKYLYSVPFVSDDDRISMLEEVRSIAREAI